MRAIEARASDFDAAKKAADTPYDAYAVGKKQECECWGVMGGIWMQLQNARASTACGARTHLLDLAHCCRRMGFSTCPVSCFL